MTFDQNVFNQFVLENGLIGFFSEPKMLSSGRRSNWYVNWRTVTEDVFLTDQLARMVIDFSLYHKLNPDTFYGVPEGATKIGLATQTMWAKMQPNYGKGSHMLAMGRGKQKEHGDPKDRSFLGVPLWGSVFIEDVTTTGASLLREIDRCLEARVRIVAAVGLTNRMEVTNDGRSVEQAVNERGIPYFALSNTLELLPLAYAKLQPGIEIGLAIEREFEEVGVQRLKLVSP